MLKGYKYEILPSEEQKELIWKTIGCNRLVYNLCLDQHSFAKGYELEMYYAIDILCGTEWVEKFN